MCGMSKGSLASLLLCAQLVALAFAGASTSEVPKSINNYRHDNAYFTYAKPSAFNTVVSPLPGFKLAASWNLAVDVSAFRSSIRFERPSAPVVRGGLIVWKNGTDEEPEDVMVSETAGM